MRSDHRGLPADLSQKVRSIAEDLTKLEINTVFKPQMTAQKMPPARHALIDIAENYSRELQLLVPGYTPITVYCHIETFDQLRETASTAIKTWQIPLEGNTMEEEARLIMLERIKRSCDLLKGILANIAKRKNTLLDQKLTRLDIVKQQPPPLPLVPDELVIIRKIWDVGTEEVAMQTVIQLDGDVVTRVQPRFAVPDCKVLHDIHRDDVDISLRGWRNLIMTVTEFFKSILETVKPF